MKLRSLLTYLSSIGGIIIVGLLLNLIFFGTDMTNVTIFCLGVAVVAAITVAVIANNKNVKLDILTYDFADDLTLLLNDIFAGILISIPISIFIISLL